MKVILYDTAQIHQAFYPLTQARALVSFRSGILTLAEKWGKHLNCELYIQTQGYLQHLYPKENKADLYIRADILPSRKILEKIKLLKSNEFITYKEQKIAYVGNGEGLELKIEKCIQVNRIWDLLAVNATQIESDIKVLKLKPSTGDAKNTTFYQPEDIYISPNASIKSATINAEQGSIYIGNNVTIDEGAILKGPLAILDGSHITMGAKLRSANTIGPNSVIGGELKNTIIQGYSNKAHEGYIGDTYIGEWVNLGAGTNGSNLKNNYSNIRMWDTLSQDYIDSGKWKLGAVIGDYVHTGITTMLNSGTTIGFGANIFGTGYQDKHIPNFTWGISEKYDLEKFLKMVKKQMLLKERSLTKENKKLIKDLYVENS